MKTVNRINTKSIFTRKKHFLNFVYMRGWMFTKLIVVITS